MRKLTALQIKFIANGRFLILALAVSCMGISCAHHINYELTDADKWTGPTIPKTVEVANFKDDAPKDKKINLRMGRDVYRINAREGYPGDGNISEPVSNMIGRHLEHSGLFEDVYYAEKPAPDGEKADYVLDGTIYDYHGMGKMHAKAEFGVMTAATFANAPGALAAILLTKDVQTDVQSSVRLNDVSLKQGRRKLWSRETFQSGSKRKAHFMDGDNHGVFVLADEELRAVVNDMIYDIGKKRTGVSARRPAREEPKKNLITGRPIEQGIEELTKQISFVGGHPGSPRRP